MHLLRDCPSISLMWDRLGFSQLPGFFGDDYREWLQHFALHDRGNVFSATCWVIWCARNEVVFNDIQWTTWKILSKIRSLHDTIVCAFGTSTLSRPARMVKWHPPAEHWVKLNVDGSSLGNPIISGFGGLLRNMHIGEWIVGFFGNCGLTTNLTAELSAIAMGILNLLGHLVLKISFASLTRRLLWS